jgi:alpha-tubulin suppressor-like RCC1 family protein
MADSSSPLLAAYYQRQMAIIDGVTYAWKGDDGPKRLQVKASQVGVGRDTYYALDKSGRLLAWRHMLVRPETLMTNVARFAAGRSGLLAITKDGTLWRINPLSKARTRIAENVTHAAVGDGANYYITKSGALFVRGKAHRGQYGDGRLTSSTEFIQTASEVGYITAHTGHAILLTKTGEVLGTGGNIYGPVGKHGLGDKADRWSRIMSGARAIATGSLHTVAIRQDATLVAWGDGYGPEPVPVMKGVVAAAVGTEGTIAIAKDGTLWQWDRGAKPRRHSLK